MYPPRSEAGAIGRTEALFRLAMQDVDPRVLVREAASTEALWLSEGLAQMAEELVAREYELADNVHATELFREGSAGRTRSYLLDPSAVSLLVAEGRSPT